VSGTRAAGGSRIYRDDRPPGIHRINFIAGASSRKMILAMPPISRTIGLARRAADARAATLFVRQRDGFLASAFPRSLDYVAGMASPGWRRCLPRPPRR
jgi:hypothetical protein